MIPRTIRVYCNETRNWDIGESEKADMTLEEFWVLDSPGRGPAPDVLPRDGRLRSRWAGGQRENLVSARSLEYVDGEIKH